MAVAVETRPTTPFEGQKPGTSGLRKAVKVFQQENYTENFIQCILDVGDAAGGALVVGGDGRYYMDTVVATIVRMAAANGVRRLIVGQNGVLSTPAVSTLIRERGVTGGIVLTASHNPGGPDADFGIKYNCSNGGPAPDALTTAMYTASGGISSYRICPAISCDTATLGTYEYKVEGVGDFTVEVVDSVEAYASLMKSIFDFPAIADFLKSFPILLDSLSGVTGPYVERIFVRELGAPATSTRNTTPLPDFGGRHPDPNLTYAADLVAAMRGGGWRFGAAFDGDGDRNMILGEEGFFVTPCDSVAVIASNAGCIPYFSGGVRGLARSMPTSGALDRVGESLGVPVYEVPTGWKYFGNLMDAGKLSICGEESFGTGSDHIREKDGVWAVLAWLSVLAKAGCGVREILTRHWAKYGRNFFTRYDYENCPAAPCEEMMRGLREQLPALAGQTLSEGPRTYTVATADDFSYTDPVDGSVASRQGIRILMTDGSRIIYRLSGTGSSGATVRLYVESYEAPPPAGEAPAPGTGPLRDAQEALGPLVQIALRVAGLPRYTGRDKPTVVT